MVKQIQDSQVNRLLDLVPYLIANQGIALDQVAKDFQISKADVLDDLNTLWMCGLPGYTALELIDLSFESGYVSIRNAEVLSKPRKLTTIEVGAIIIGLCILRESYSPSDVQIQVIEDLIARLSKKSHVTAPVALSGAVSNELRTEVNSAITTKRNLMISYHSFSRDEVTNREITPFSIKHDETYEYVESFCHLAQDFRSFRLDRILHGEVGASASNEFPRNEHAEDDRIEIHIRIQSNSRKIAETFSVKVAEEFHQGDVIKSSVYNLEWIIRTISSLRSSAIVIQPLDVRSQVQLRAKKALDLYV
jgi:proteasome accessory factor C